MPTLRACMLLALLLPVGALSACASAADRLEEGIALQARGQYVAAVDRYAEALEKDPSLAEARERILVAGDSALLQAMAEADGLERRGEPVAAADRYRAMDRMLARIRSVGLRPRIPQGYEEERRVAFDRAGEWLMAEGYEAQEGGRWAAARDAFRTARGDYEPASARVEESLDAETHLLLEWADTELRDGRPRAAFARAEEAAAVRRSPARDVVLRVRDLQGAALERGTVVVAMLPVTARSGVRDHLGPEFEVALDDELARRHWTRPPLFVDVADPVILRRELRGLLRGRAASSPLVVGRALELIGADLGVLVEVSAIEVVEEGVEREAREALVAPGGRDAVRRGADTVTYHVARGFLVYDVEAVGILVDPDGREVATFTAVARERGPFERGEYGGDPSTLDLEPAEERLFSPEAPGEQRSRIEAMLLERLAVAIAVGAYDTVLAGVP